MKNCNLLAQLFLLGIGGLTAAACGQASTSESGSGGTTGSVTTTGGAGLGGNTNRASGGASGSAGNPVSAGSPANGGFPSGGSKAAGGAPASEGVKGGAGTGGRGISTTSGGTGGTTKTTANGGSLSSGGTGGTGGSGSSTSAGGASSATGATILPDPSWTCGMPDGIPDPTRGELVFRASLQLGATHDVGLTQFGHRRILDVKGGTLTGTRVQATVLELGLDLELTLSNGSVELEQINILRASDGTLIYMRNCGVAAAGDKAVRVVADFEVPTGKSLAWLNTGKYVGTRVVDAAAGTLQLDVYDVSKVAIAEPKIQLKDPTGVPNASWDCVTGTGTKGATVFTENVTLGSSVTVGASKRGSRNIIPITGGTTTGKVEGAILAGGGDYQLSGLDARYTLAPKDGEFILVRNCGPASALIPTFEARADGPYAFLNANTFMSSGPGSSSGGVSITFYERK